MFGSTVLSNLHGDGERSKRIAASLFSLARCSRATNGERGTTAPPSESESSPSAVRIDGDAGVSSQHKSGVEGSGVCEGPATLSKVRLRHGVDESLSPVE